jgi:DNA-directed RNA polymerase specialized sigma24 family protein
MAVRPVDGEAALDALFRAHATPLLKLAVVLTGDRSLAEDLVQDAFVRLHSATGRTLRSPSDWRRCDERPP